MIESVVSELAHPLDPRPTGVDPVLPRLEGIRAVLFDVYGTLLISGSGDVGVATESSNEQLFIDALRAAGQRYLGEAPQGLADFHAEIAAEHKTLKSEGVDFPEVRIEEIWMRVIEKWHASGLVEEPVSADVISRFAIEYEMRMNPVWPMPNLVDTLDRLKDAGLTLGIISNAQSFTPKLFEPLTQRSVDSLGFIPELCFWSYEHRQAKPGKFLYEQAADVLVACGLSPETTLYVGNDMLNDIMPASTVGFQTVLFAGDERSLRLRDGHSDVAGVEPTATVTDLSQLATVCLAEDAA